VEAELKASYPDSEVTLVRSGGGIFDVKCDGKLIYSKHNAAGQRFPNTGEITTLIKEKMG
jgi:selT/selW/selH-like putative selenoprotein